MVSYSICAMRTVEARPLGRSVWLLPTILVPLFGGTAYSAAIAIGLLDVGPVPGDMPPGEFLGDLAWIALLFGGFLLLAAAPFRSAAEWLASPLLPFVPLAAAAFAVADYLSYDAYYAPGLVRVASVSNVGWGWIALLVVGGVGAALLAWRWPRQTVAVQGLYLLLVLVTVFLVGPFY
jgi:hypothetical protein